MPYVGLLFLAHLAIDFFLTAFPPLLPFLMRELDLSIGLAGTLVAAKSLSSGLGQPLFGLLLDRRGRAWLLPLSVAWVGLFVAAIGISRGYPLALALSLIAGLGGALFHPLGAVMVRRAAGPERTASAMAVFSLGGTVGMAIAPLLTVLVAARLGLSGLLLFAIPALVVPALCFLGGLHGMSLGGERGPSLGRRHAPPTEGLPGAPTGQPAATPWGATRTGGPEGRPASSRAVILLNAAAVLRVLAQAGLATYLPLYYVLKGHPEAFGGLMLTVYLTVGAASAMLGGYLGDRWGRKRLSMLSMLATTPLMLAFLNTGGWLGVLFLLLTGSAFFSTFSVTIVYAQELMPHRPALASGLVMGFVWALASLAVVPLGALADRIGLPAALHFVAVLPLVACALLIGVPEPARRPAPSPDPAVPQGDLPARP